MLPLYVLEVCVVVLPSIFPQGAVGFLETGSESSLSCNENKNMALDCTRDTEMDSPCIVFKLQSARKRSRA